MTTELPQPADQDLVWFVEVFFRWDGVDAGKVEDLIAAIGFGADWNELTNMVTIFCSVAAPTASAAHLAILERVAPYLPPGLAGIEARSRHFPQSERANLERALRWMTSPVAS